MNRKTFWTVLRYNILTVILCATSIFLEIYAEKDPSADKGFRIIGLVVMGLTIIISLQIPQKYQNFYRGTTLKKFDILSLLALWGIVLFSACYFTQEWFTALTAWFTIGILASTLPKLLWKD